MKKKWILPLSSTALLAFLIGIFQSTITSSFRGAFAEEKPNEKAGEVKGADSKTAKAGDAKLGEKGDDATKKEDASEVVADEGDGKVESGDQVTKRILSRKYQGCLTDEVALKDMQRARTELEKKRKDIEKKESEIAAREKAVQEELKKVEDLQKELKTSQGVLQAKDEEKISKLVETFESMSPKAAALIVGSLDKKLAVQAMSRVTPQKLGKILSAMPTAKSSDLTEALAGVVRAKVEVKESSNGDTVTADAVKGGDKNANQQQQPNSIPSQQASQNQNSGREPASGPSGRTPAK